MVDVLFSILLLSSILVMTRSHQFLLAFSNPPTNWHEHSVLQRFWWWQSIFSRFIIVTYQNRLEHSNALLLSHSHTSHNNVILHLKRHFSITEPWINSSPMIPWMIPHRSPQWSMIVICSPLPVCQHCHFHWNDLLSPRKTFPSMLCNNTNSIAIIVIIIVPIWLVAEEYINPRCSIQEFAHLACLLMPRNLISHESSWDVSPRL